MQRGLLRGEIGGTLDPTTVTFIVAIVGALLVIIGAIVLATFLNKGAATREAALLSALGYERAARAKIEQEREVERSEAKAYREVTDKRMAALELEVSALKSKLAVNEARYDIERATLMNLLRNQTRPSDAGYLPDTPQSEDGKMRDWIAKHFLMDGDIDQLAADAAMPQPPPGSVNARAQWMTTWTRANGMSGNLAVAAKKARPRIKSWEET